MTVPAPWIGNDVLGWFTAAVFLMLCVAVVVGSHAVASILKSAGSRSVLEAAGDADEFAAARSAALLEASGDLEAAHDAYERLAASGSRRVTDAARMRADRLARVLRVKMFVEYVCNIEFSRQVS